MKCFLPMLDLEGGVAGELAVELLTACLETVRCAVVRPPCLCALCAEQASLSVPFRSDDNAPAVEADLATVRSCALLAPMYSPGTHRISPMRRSCAILWKPLARI